MSSAEPPMGTGLPAARPDPPDLPRLVLAILVVFGSALALALHAQSVLQDPRLSGTLLSDGLQKQIVAQFSRSGVLGGRRELPLGALIPLAITFVVGLWLLGATVPAIVRRTGWRTTLYRWGLRFLWIWGLAIFELRSVVGGLLATGQGNLWLARTAELLPFVHVVVWGGLLASRRSFWCDGEAGWLRRSLAHPAIVWLAAAGFAATFSWLSILQYRALMVPHGDSAMYEEHLWNLLHGKGFRSQLDGGRLFFGEHLEVIHLLLLPLYLFSPSLSTLNICLSVGLGSGAIAVRGITRKLTDSAVVANWLGVAYLLYFPLQYLNLEASLKTFRPENLGVPLLLFAIWALEAGRVRTMLVLLGLTLLAKEDYAIPVGMIGLYLAVRRSEESTGRTRLLGLGVLVFAGAFLWFVLDVFIPYFREGPPHYMDYFPELGGTPREIVANVLRNPGVLIDPLVTGNHGERGFQNLLFLLMLVVPLGGLPLLGVGRFWLLIPTLLSILLIALPDARLPFFHFHAPLVPVLFWAAAEGARRLRIADCRSQIGSQNHRVAGSSNLQSAICNLQSRPAREACFAAACALVAGAIFGKSPLSIAFFDPNSGMRGFGLALYARSPRSQSFEEMFAKIPLDASVAVTDYARPRFTHHRKCFPYGDPNRPVPVESIDYIVVDLQGPFSEWPQSRRIAEVEAQPDRWEVVYDDLLYFRVVRQRDESSPTPDH